ncbi:MAG TPA: NAD(P)-binding protein [Gemmatimonadales bacterium]|jgi:spermidine dehydrogenase|nr:NAD(P)-binding protein [Gemmatimonadales bacterium]
MSRFDREERDLGLDTTITRRDFLDATLLAAGAALFNLPAPASRQAPASALSNPDWEGFAGIGDYARSHGNTWEAVSVAHQLRDGKFDSSARSMASDTGEAYDLIVVGGGLSGLAAAAFFHKRERGRCLLLDNHPMVGGEAKRNEFVVDGVHLIGPQGSNDFGTRLPSGWVGEYWKELGLPYGVGAFEHQAWAPGVKPLEITRDNYTFQIWSDEFASHGFFFEQADGSLRLVRDAFGAGLPETPWSEALRRDFIRWRSNPKFYEGADLARWLDGMTYEQLLVKVHGLDPAVARYTDPILAGAAGGLGSDVISARCAAQIGLPGTVNGPGGGRWQSQRLADTLESGTSFPGGNDGIMRHVLKLLLPRSIVGEGFAGILNGRVRFAELDRRGNPTRIRLAATAIRVTNLPDGTVEVIYAQGGRLYRTSARGVVMANGAWASQYIVADLPDGYREAFRDFVRAPMLVVNVALKRWRFMYEQGLTAASYRDRFGFSCNIRQSMVAGDYRPQLHPDKPTILTFYVPFQRPGSPLKDQAVAARTELLATTYREYERRIREQLVRLFGSAGFDPRADIGGIILNRWGHAYVCPAPGFYFGRDGKPAAPDVLRQTVGRVAFANAELHGHQNWRDATAEGKRAAEQLFG